ncbi:MAG: MMPL family transporter [Gammaproteobacteria bacterium]|nr:MMPL family transporter [Gammaproteobacteria bacterium]
MRTDIGDFFYPGGSEDPGYLVTLQQSDELERRYLVSIGHPDVDVAASRKFLEELQNSLAQSGLVQHIWTEPLGQADVRQLLRFYAPHQQHLYSLEPEREITRLLDPEGMALQATMIREALLGPDPSLAKSLLRDDPMLLTLSWFRKVGEMYKQPEPDPTYSAFFLETRDAGLDTAAQQRFIRTLVETFNGLNAGFGKSFTLEFTGVPVFATSIHEQVRRDVNRIGTLSIGLVVLLSWLVFRSLRALICICIMLFASASIAILSTQLVYGYLHGLTLALGATLIGVSVDYFIHGMVNSGDRAGTDRQQAIRRIWPALLLGGTTTLIGYTALSFSGFPGLQQVAVFTSSGIIAALVITRFMLSDLMSLFRVQVRPRVHLSWLLSIGISTQSRVLILAVVACVQLIYGSRMHWDDDLSGLAPTLERLADTDRSIRARFSSIEPGRFIIVSGDDMESTLRVAEVVQRRLAILMQEGKLDLYYPLFPWIASMDIQSRNVKAWNDAVNADVQEQWDRVLLDKGLSAESFPGLSSQNKPFLDPERALTSPVATLLSTQFIAKPDGVAAVIWLGRHVPQALQDALRPIQGARYFSQKDNIQQLSREYRKKAQTMLIWGVLVILILLAVRYRSLKISVLALAPATLSIMMIVAAWGMFGVSVGILHLIGLLLTAAVCVDYGIFFLENRSGDIKVTFQAITISAFTTAAAFGSLGVAENPALHALAGTVGPGALAGFLLCPIMLGRPGRGIRDLNLV